MRVLVVEDDPRIAEPVAAALKSQQHVVDVASDGQMGLTFSEADRHDVVLLDMMLPGVDGMTICRAMRKRGSPAAILMMTARDSVSDKVRALDAGADDYVVKPFELEELLARVRALSRRGVERRPRALRCGKIELSESRACVTYAGRPVDLTRTEYAILEVLLRHPARVFGSDELYERIRNFDGAGASATIKTHILNLRRKLRAGGALTDPIVTVHGFGYRLSDD